MVARDRPPSSTSKEEEEKRMKKKLPRFPILRSSWRRGRSPWSSRDLTISTATVTSTFVCSVPASVSWHKVEEYVLLSASLLGLLVTMHFALCFPLLSAFLCRRGGGCARRRPRQWYVYGWFCWRLCNTRCVFALVAARQWHARLVLLVWMLHAPCFLRCRQA